MRILFTVHQFLPDFSAGTELVSYHVAKELKSRGHQVCFVSGHPGAPVVQPDESRFDRYDYEGIRVHRFTHAYVPMGGQSNIALLEHDNPMVGRFFGGVLEEFKPDLVHAFHLARLSTSPLEVCEKKKIPVIFTATDFWAVCPLSQLLLPCGQLCRGPSSNAGNCIKHLAIFQKPTLARRALQYVPDALVGAAAAMVRHHCFPPTPFNPLAAAMSGRPKLLRDRFATTRMILSPSSAVREILLENGFDPQRTLHLRNGIDTSKIPRRTDKGTQKELRVGFIGTLAPHKAPHVAVDAILKLPRDLPIRLSIFGHGDPASPYSQQLKTRAAEDKRIVFAGSFRNDSVGNVLANFDVLVVPSTWYENTPTVMYEAQAAGCVVVASDLGGMSEMIRPEVDGLLFPPGDSESLSQCLNRLCEDRALTARLAAAAPHPPTVQEQVTQLESLYSQVLSASPR